MKLTLQISPERLKQALGEWESWESDPTSFDVGQTLLYLLRRAVLESSPEAEVTLSECPEARAVEERAVEVLQEMIEGDFLVPWAQITVKG